ncbi:MAG TPA: YbjQ family protein [Bacteroidia bacterium]|nr:YbjQ family protein [Bacteroidia bacterium]
MEKNMITNALQLDGYKIVKNMGVVRGITVRSRNVFANIGASLQSLVGGNISLYAQLCERAREDAFELMLQHAQQMGANAVICMRYDANEVAPGITEVLAYGTAVTVEKN